jgi:hypothetical protein
MYIVIFEDYTQFIGGDPNNSRWNEMPNKRIRELVYKLGDYSISLSGFSEYNHLVERVSFLNKRTKKISKVIIMGHQNFKVYKFIIDLLKSEVNQEETLFGKEYNNASTTGWKKGIKGVAKVTLL